MSDPKNTTKDKPKESEALEMRIKATDEDLKGIYSNIAMIRHNENEFILDFMQKFDKDKAQLVSRIFTNPQHMKKLGKAIIDNIKKFEDKFGEIDI